MSYIIRYALIIVALIALAILDVCTGSNKIPLSDILDYIFGGSDLSVDYQFTIREFRLARLIAAPDPTTLNADFTGSPTTVDVGGTVAFRDASTGDPTSWNWTFPGGSPASSTAQNPSVVYSTAGTYNVT